MSNFTYEFRVRRVRRSTAKCPGATYGRIMSSESAAAMLSSLTDSADRESFFAVYLDIKNAVLGYEEVFVGTMTGVDVHPREVFRGALLASAAGIIVGHNHPSGDIAPSLEDRALTKRLRECGDMMGIPVLDHVIVATDNKDYFSFAEAADAQ